MFKLTLLKHFMPIALSVCMVVQSVPATAFAAEQTETVVEETQTNETETTEASTDGSDTDNQILETPEVQEGNNTPVSSEEEGSSNEESSLSEESSADEQSASDIEETSTSAESASSEEASSDEQSASGIEEASASAESASSEEASSDEQSASDIEEASTSAESASSEEASSDEQSASDIEEASTSAETYDSMIELYADGETTSDAVDTRIPESISIVDADKDLKLTYEYGDNTVLKVNATPRSASADVYWSSDNEDVVSVASDGSIFIYGVGEATITATSQLDKAKTSKRKVSVKDFRVIDELNGNETLHSIDIYKKSNADPSNKTIYVATGIGFYEVDKEGTTTKISDFTVTSNKPGVADWSETTDGKVPGIAGYSAGATLLTFEKDGYQAAINVSVYPESKGFGIVGLTASNSSYPAIDKSDNTYEIATATNYRAVGMINPDEYFYAPNFIWTSSNENVATVTDGWIYPVGKGETTITVTPKDPKNFTNEAYRKAEFKLVVKELPPTDTSYVNALTNTSKTLADVVFPADWKDWVWKEPQTPLYNIPVGSNDYAFEAVYNGSEYYACERTLDVYMSTITGVYAYARDEIGYLNGVLSTGTNATLVIVPDYIGDVPDDTLYTISTPTAGNGLTITPAKGEDGKDIPGEFTIKADKAGKYTLKLEIKSKAGDMIIATGKYSLTVVGDPQVGSIEITSADDTKAKIEYGMISFDSGTETTTFNLAAKAYNRGTEKTENTTTKLDWKITDKSVADVKADKSDTHKATVTVKGEGHAVIQVTAKDASGEYAQVNLEIRNHAPRVEGSKATVNTALDYENYSGKELSSTLYGDIEVIPVYGRSISKVTVVNEDGTTESTNFEAYNSSGRYYTIVPKAGAAVANGTYKCNLSVTTASSDDNAKPYTYPITVSVINKKPKVKAKTTQSPNLFYTTDRGRAEITLENTSYSIEELTWKDKTGASTENNDKGFEFSYNTYNSKRPNIKLYTIYQKTIEVSNGKLVDPNMAEGTLTIKLHGVKEAYTFDNFKIKYSYKKPKLKTIDVETGKNTSSLIPSMGATDSRFRLYDNLKKRYLSYSNYSTGYYYYYKLDCANNDVDSIEPDETYIYFNYAGDKKSDTLALTVTSKSWRESLTVNHKVKAIQPKAVLSNPKLIYNTEYVNEVFTTIFLKDYYYLLDFTDIAIAGANAKSQALLDDDRLQLIHGGYDSYGDDSVYARLNKLKITDDTMPSGSYSYNLTPYYKDPTTGEKKALNKLKLTITFTDKPITAKVSAKGKLDLAQRDNTYIRLTPKFSNMGSNYSVTKVTLVGEYSKYFRLVRDDNYYNYPNGVYDLKADSDSLKAGHTYNLAVEYTVRASGGEIFTVTSNRFKVKPKQTAPKVTVITKPQNLYAAASITRRYIISVPNTYDIDGVSGGIDINKDGYDDLSVSVSTYYGSYAYLTVRIQDRDAVIAAAKGKSYSIPVTVRVTGRDGISKDASAKIKVNIKR